MLDAARELVVIGRAGIGLDNVDVVAATRRGVLVANAPQSNIISAAEHTMALLLAQARNVAQAHRALVAGRWERSRWEGVELHGKTLGVVGLGRVGALVAQRAAAFGMHLVAYDPFVSAERSRQLGVELLALDEVVRRSDFLTVHLPRTPETVGLIGTELLGLAKPGLRIVNVARGGIVDEAALAEALDAGTIAGAALDVFAAEPTTSSPLFSSDKVVVTPHLGASTREAQDKAGLAIAEQVTLALAGHLVPFAVNIAASEVPEAVAPFVPLAEQLGRLWASIARELPGELEVVYEGGLADADTRLLTLSVLRGVCSVASDEPVSWVNAAQIAEERGLDVRSTTASATGDYVNLLTVRGGGHAVAGTIFAHSGVHRIVMVDDHDIELPLARWIIMVRNDDSIGVVAAVAARHRRRRAQHRGPQAGAQRGGGHGDDGPLVRGAGARRGDRRPHRDPRRAGRLPPGRGVRPARRCEAGCEPASVSAWPARSRRPRRRPRCGSSGPPWSARRRTCRAGGTSRSAP